MKRWLTLGAGVAALLLVAFVVARVHRQPSDDLPDIIPVELLQNGSRLGSLDREFLGRTPPDLVQGSTRAWRLRRLIPSAALDRDTSVIVEDGQGLRFVLSTPRDLAEGRQPVVALDGRGQLRPLLAADGDLLALLEGRDGKREEHSTDLARDRRPARIILIAAGDDDAVARSPVSISAMVDDQPAVAWTRRELAAVRQLDVVPSDGEGHRTAWSLRDLAHDLVGDEARVVAVVGEHDERYTVRPDDWEDASRIPILRLNRRGHVKFEWVNRDLSPAEAERLREVTSVVLVSQGSRVGSTMRRK
jgi:hypothetical protein